MYGFNEGLFDDIVDIDVPDTAVVIDVDDTVDEGPEVGVATGIADMVLRLINAENDTITDYNSARTTLAQDPAYAEFIEVIDDIEAEELKHVGQLQTLLKRLSPNASNIEAGEEEAEGQLTEDLDNMERVTKGKNIDVHGDIPIVMADAVMTSEEADKAVEDELEEHNKKTNVKLNKVLGAEKQPVPKLPEMAKVTLDESLFEDYGNVREYSDQLFDMIEEGLVDAKEIAQDLIYWCSEDDIKRFMEVRDLIWNEEDEDVDESLNEAYDTDVVAGILSGFIPMPKRGFKYLSSNGDNGEVEFKGTKYAFRKKSDGSYKVMTSSAAGSNWSETLYKDEEVEKQYRHNKLIEGRKSQDFVDSHGISYSDEDRSIEDEDDLFSMVEEELCPTTYKFMKHTKFPDVSWHRYSSSEVRVDPDFNIEVDVEDPDRLDFAFKVADAYNLPVKGPFKLRNGKYALTIKIEE